MNRLERIQHMEQILDDATEALRTLSELRPRLAELAAYYEGGQWMEDYEADEAGLLPADLKRGVLSEDAVYDLLNDYDQLIPEWRKVPNMKKVRITVMKMACYRDLMELYENPIQHACDMEEGMVFIANGWERPEGLCLSAWESMSAFVMALAHGGGNFYDGWMKNPRSAMISCNDGFRPVSFLLEALDEEAE